jgi:hypothetical protein
MSIARYINAGRESQRLAEERAQQLLLSILPEDLGREFQASGTIMVASERNTYILSLTSQTEIRNRTTGKPFAHACLDLSVTAPACDRMVAEYLLITNDEELYWQAANIFPHLQGFVRAIMVVLTFALVILIDIALIYLL